jgi:hypothetical protein
MLKKLAAEKIGGEKKSFFLKSLFYDLRKILSEFFGYFIFLFPKVYGNKKMEKKSFLLSFLCENTLTGYTLGAGYTLGPHCILNSLAISLYSMKTRLYEHVMHL